MPRIHSMSASMPAGLRIAIQALGSHKLRAVLAMLGVFLGTLALTGVMHVSKAMIRKAEIETAKLGPNLFMATSGNVRFRRRSGTIRFSGSNTSFTMADAQALADGMPMADNSAPFIQRTINVRHGHTTVTGQLMATTPAYQNVRSFSPSTARFLMQDDVDTKAMVCVLGKTLAERLFSQAENALGKEIFVFRARLKVVGIMEEKGKDLSGTDQDEQFFVPISTYMRRMSNQTWITGVYLNIQQGVNDDIAKETAADILRARRDSKNGKDDFRILSAKDASRLQSEALDLVWTLGVMSASISFMVGSMGILSIMILLVRARRLEIGVRRAVGARRGAIMLQFLLEAGLMSGAGGMMGVAASLGLVTVVYTYGDFPFIYDPLVISGAAIASILLGIAAGAYPAWQASRVEVLKVLQGR